LSPGAYIWTILSPGAYYNCLFKCIVKIAERDIQKMFNNE